MKSLKLFSLSMFFLINSHFLHAQGLYNSWFRATYSVPLNHKLKLDTEFQHRRQNGFSNQNLFDKNLMFTYRNWVHYENSSHVKFSVSPFAYFKNSVIIQEKEDENKKANSEIRISGAVEISNNIYKDLKLINRSAIEYRFGAKNRFRHRLGLGYTLSDRIKASMFQEFFLNSQNIDHTRAGLNLELKVLPKLKVDLGFIQTHRFKNNGQNKFNESNFVLNLTYQKS